MNRRSVVGSRVWITGASSGIGAALANELTDRGALVAISARRTEELHTIAAGRMSVVPVDVTDLEAMRTAADDVRAHLGGIDMVVLNAGTWLKLRLSELDPAVVAKHFEVNVMGTVNGLAAVINEMIRARAGTIVIVASVAGFRGMPGSLAYGATKAALINMAESVRAEASRSGIRVVTVNPGFIRTPMTETNTFPMPFLIDADEAARSIVNGLESNRQEITFPLQMAVAMKIARVLPVRVWTFLSSRAARPKKRR
jgi:short-subunit dehydrogenase